MKEEILKAVEVLRKGGVILYPTDTVWGIGCDATNEEAVKRIYDIKHRDDSKSLVLLASDMDMICRYVKEVPEMALASGFIPVHLGASRLRTETAALTTVSAAYFRYLK